MAEFREFILALYPAGFFIATCSGFFGAAFFMLIELQKNLAKSGVSDLRDMWTWNMLILRCLVGTGAAAILYFFFESEIVSGSLWPDLNSIGTTPLKVGEGVDGARTVPNKDLALLVVWSFLAGYSQTLVPNLLLKTEGGREETNV